MALALGSLVFGIVAYLVTLALQSRASRVDLESWGDIAFMCAIPATMFAVLWLFTYIGEGGRVSAVATTEAMLEPQKIRSLPVLGLLAVGFLAPALVHVMALKWRRSRDRHDA
jgi:hypothetical protein